MYDNYPGNVTNQAGVDALRRALSNHFGTGTAPVRQPMPPPISLQPSGSTQPMPQTTGMPGRIPAPRPYGGNRVNGLQNALGRVANAQPVTHNADAGNNGVGVLTRLLKMRQQGGYDQPMNNTVNTTAFRSQY